MWCQWEFPRTGAPACAKEPSGQMQHLKGFPCGSVGKESACHVGDLGSIPGLGRSPGQGKGYPLQYSGLENSMDCIVHGVAKSQTQLSDFHFLPLQRLICGCRSIRVPPKIDIGPLFLPLEGLITFCFGGPWLPGNLAGSGQ